MCCTKAIFMIAVFVLPQDSITVSTSSPFLAKSQGRGSFHSRIIADENNMSSMLFGSGDFHSDVLPPVIEEHIEYNVNVSRWVDFLT